MQFQCPHCQKGYYNPKAKPGIQAKCAGCGQKFTIAHRSIEITPTPRMPFDKIMDKPARSDATKKKTKSFLHSAWAKCPTPFKTAFLSTLGVLCAVWFAVYVMNLPGKVIHADSTAAAESAFEPVKIEDKTNYLAAATALIQIHAQYQVLHTLRVETAQNSVNDLDFAITIKHIKSPLEQLYLSMQEYRLPNQSTIQKVYGSLSRAIENEYRLVCDAQTFVLNPDDLAAKAAVKKSIESSQHSQTESLLGVSVLMMQFDDNFWNAYMAVLNQTNP